MPIVKFPKSKVIIKIQKLSTLTTFDIRSVSEGMQFYFKAQKIISQPCNDLTGAEKKFSSLQHPYSERGQPSKTELFAEIVDIFSR